MTIQIEEGKFYRTRDGRKVGPMLWSDQEDGYCWTDARWPGWWSDEGERQSREDETDLIAEWTDDKTPTIWRDMTDEQRAPILLHWARGGKVQFLTFDDEWRDTYVPPGAWNIHAYRIKPSEPEPMTLYGNLGDAAWSQKACGGDTHSITMTLRPPEGTYTHESGAEITIAEVNQ